MIKDSGLRVNIALFSESLVELVLDADVTQLQ